ncbi:ATP-dependent DNA helicase [Aphis craccivora]|uniref:ATP-dependent DNA helicase n=1 Tax=Aphis craccivora TaxID=307492 RepID=A0A6G0ZFK5_APHCR|nr:ATP-dependent DNA helicase [Aphis craccivora]
MLLRNLNPPRLCNGTRFSAQKCNRSHRVKSLDKTLQNIRSSKDLMGGMTVLLAGDFRPTLSVVARGTHADILRACLILPMA